MVTLRLFWPSTWALYVYCTELVPYCIHPSLSNGNIAMSLSTSTKTQIQTLLRRSIGPILQVDSSSMNGAGLGVFATKPIARDAAVCLYPGIFSPGLPRAFSDATYFGNTILPSGVVPPEMNAYILNLKSVGGFLDGLATTTEMTQNPAACAQLVNHNRDRCNVHVISFWWHDVLDCQTSESSWGTGDAVFYAIPNRRRCDGAPWFFHREHMIYYNEKERTTPCAGAVFCASRDIDDEELFLDYGLQQPLPPWAEGWYDKV